MFKICISFLMVAVFAFVGLAFGDMQQCNEPQVKAHAFNLTTHQNTYTVYRFCYKYFGENNLNYEKYGITSHGTWNATTGKATETVDIHDTYFYDGAQKNDQHYPKTTSADCPNDPWLNQVSCTNNWIDPTTPVFWFALSPYPLAVQGLSASEKSYLKSKLSATQRKAAPEILLPKQNQKYTNGQLLCEARVSVPDEDDPGQWKVEIETNMDPSQPSPHNIPISHSHVVTGVGTSWFYLDLPFNGFWLVRARSTSPKHTSDWSNQVRYEISGTKGPQFIKVPLKSNIKKRL